MKTIDRDCARCGERARERVCSECGVSAWICDCGCKAQPRPIAAGRVGTDGMPFDTHRDFCAECAEVVHA